MYHSWCVSLAGNAFGGWAKGDGKTLGDEVAEGLKEEEEEVVVVAVMVAVVVVVAVVVDAMVVERAGGLGSEGVRTASAPSPFSISDNDGRINPPPLIIDLRSLGSNPTLEEDTQGKKGFSDTNNKKGK